MADSITCSFIQLNSELLHSVGKEKQKHSSILLLEVFFISRK